MSEGKENCCGASEGVGGADGRRARVEGLLRRRCIGGACI